MGLFSFFNDDRGVFRQLQLGDGKSLNVSPMPYGAYDPGNRVFKVYLKNSIEHVVMLIREEEYHKKARKDIRNLYLKNGMEYKQFEMVDLTAPSYEVLDDVIHYTVDLVNRGIKTVIHCHAGTGRTAVIACCAAAVVNKLSANDAIQLIKESMEVHMVDEQERLIRRWAEETDLLDR